MQNTQDKIWYASYGSNILEDRFLCYIKGGKPNGSSKEYTGCRDKTPPTENEDFYICSELYFAKNSVNWENGGVGFIRTIFKPQASTFGRIYLITKEQFIDVAKQETSTEGELEMDFNKAIKEGSYIFKQRSWYGNLIHLGEQKDYPIFTFTNEEDIQPFTKPSKNYIQTIIRGIKETHNFDDKTILEYLSDKGGIKNNYSDQELRNIINECETRK